MARTTRTVPAQSRTPLLFLLLACATICIAVNSQSMWIDEASVAMIIDHPTLQGLWHGIYAENTSNLQLPLYFFYVWNWQHLAGNSELALRAANIPWFLLGFFAIAHFLRRHSGLRTAALLIYCLHPFVWFYLDEARPYLMQLSGALLVTGCLFEAWDGKEAPLPSMWWWLLALGYFILCGASFVGVPWAVGVTIILMFRPGFWASLRRSGTAPVILSSLLLIPLAIYYAWTLREKIRSGTLPMSVGSSFAIFYEQLGFLGLGPGRNTLRVASFSAVRPFLLPLVVLAIPLAWGIAMAARRGFGLSRRQLLVILLMIGSCLCLILVFGFLHHARILARHLTPMFPFILLAQAFAVLVLWRNGSVISRAASVLIILALTVSSLEIRFAFRHSKDDYRAAIAAARAALAQGKTVWWLADNESAIYYHLPLATREQPRGAHWMMGVASDATETPDEIFISKPDIFDPNGAAAQYIATHHYAPVAKWQAFTLWERPAH